MNASYRTNVIFCELYDLARSRIEVIIGLALVTRLSAWLYSDSDYRKVVLSLNEGDRYGSFAVVSGFRIHPQIEVDFAVFHPDLSPTHPLAVIEADGHEFHARTPEQVSRDRWRERKIQRLCLGVPVLRYPGADVVRRTDKCVEEIAECIDMILERTGLHHGYSPVRLFDGRSLGAAQVP